MNERRARSFESIGLSPEACGSIRRIWPGLPAGVFLSTVLPRLIAGKDIRGTLRDYANDKKTAAYLVTIFEKFNKHRVTHGGVRALILTATRDMASRIFECAQKLFTSTDIGVVYLKGGESHQKPDVVIVTPDTIIQHLSSSSSAVDGILCLRTTVGLLIIDGASEMFHLGFGEHLNKIVGQLGELDRQTLLFTTQLTAQVVVLAKKILRKPFWVSSSTTTEMNAMVSSLGLGQVQEKKKPCVEHPNITLQDPCPPPTRHCSDDANKKKMMMMKKKKATDDDIEEAGSFRKRARNSMDVD